MKIRKEFSVLLVLLSLILALLPLTANRSFTAKPAGLLAGVLDDDASFNADQVAGFIVREDPAFQLIDLRSEEEFRKQALPGAVNVPYPEFIKSDPDIWLSNEKIRTIFYSTGDLEADYALVYARGLGYKNSYSLAGGITEWIRTVIETKFTGERITARENALFETRKRAGEMFTELNSLPDSLKLKYLESKKFSAKKLDGGCE
ncbi:MAG: rhodanese-like domain-containing protein, partial [Bacteroidales bacterium]|nr:rhodanese-like domain-containing protein [Bacteroidales bacterium]